jgi:hypothetical protein
MGKLKFIIFAAALTLFSPLSAKAKMNAETAARNSDYKTDEGAVIKVVNQNHFKRVILKTAKGETKAYNIYPCSPTIDFYQSLYAPYEGSQASVVYAKDAREVPNSNPPQKDAIAIVIKDSSLKTVFDYFDGDLKAANGKRELSIADTTRIYDEFGNPLTTEDIKNSELVVFYTIESYGETEKIIPKKIVKLEPYNTKEFQIGVMNIFSQFPEEAVYSTGETSYYRLSDTSAKFGASFSWNGEDQSIEINQGALRYEIKIGVKNLAYKNSRSSLIDAPIVRDSKTFIPADLAYDIAYGYYLRK